MGDDRPPADGDAEAAAREAYASSVEDYFLRRRGTATLISPRDWALVSGWFDEGIPLPIVLAGLAQVFDRHVATGQVEPVSSISYCRHAVRKRFVEFQRTAAGGEAAPKPKKKSKGEDEPDKSLVARFEEAAARLAETAPVVAEALREILPSIAAIERDDSVAASDREGKLIDLERELARTILPRLPEEDRLAVASEAEAPFARLRVMPSAEEMERLREVGRLRAIRHRFALPRFTLLPR